MADQNQRFRFLKRIWRVLLDERHRKAIAFVGAGLAAVIAAGWTIYLHLVDQGVVRISSPQTISATVRVDMEKSSVGVAVEETGVIPADSDFDAAQRALSQRAKSSAVTTLTRQISDMIYHCDQGAAEASLYSYISSHIIMLQFETEVDLRRGIFSIQYVGELEIKEDLSAIWMSDRGSRSDNECIKLEVRIETPNNVFGQGEEITLVIRGSRDFYAAVFFVGFDGTVIPVTENFRQDDDIVKKYPGNTSITIPENSRYAMRAAPPYGTDEFVIFASTRSFDLFERPTVRIGSVDSLLEEWNEYRARFFASEFEYAFPDLPQFYVTTYKMTILPDEN